MNSKIVDIFGTLVILAGFIGAMVTKNESTESWMFCCTTFLGLGIRIGTKGGDGW